MLVSIDVAGVDGSEVHMFRGEIAAINALAPVVFGDEMVGRVAAIGADAASRRGLREGDRVVVEARWPCNACRPCRKGNYYLCDRRWEKGGYGWIRCDSPPHLWGGYATHVFVPEEALVYRVDDDLPDDTALVAGSVLANSIYWTEAAGVGLGSRVAVIGPGPQGIGAAILASMRGAEVVIAGLPGDDRRLELAERLSGARTVTLEEGAPAKAHGDQLRAALGGLDADIVIEAAGAQGAKDLAVEAVTTGGTIANCSVPAASLAVDFTALLLKQVMTASPLGHPHTVPAALRLGAVLREAGRDPADMVTHAFALDDAERAVRTAGYETEQKPIKTVIRPAGP
jgi:threonine dehydrogenase-like Zn-dependent dehydrogenase